MSGGIVSRVTWTSISSTASGRLTVAGTSSSSSMVGAAGDTTGLGAETSASNCSTEWVSR